MRRHASESNNLLYGSESGRSSRERQTEVKAEHLRLTESLSLITSQDVPTLSEGNPKAPPEHHQQT